MTKATIADTGLLDERGGLDMGEAVQFSGATVGPEEIAARIGVQPGQREAMTRWLRARGVRYINPSFA